MKFGKYLILSLLSVNLLTSCKDPEDPEEKQPEPAPTYNFSNVNYSNQTNLIAMMSAIDSVTNKGTTAGYVISASQLKNMFSNTGSPFTNNALNTSGVNLKANTAAAAATQMETWMDDLAALSSSNSTTAADGVAGVGTTSTGSKYLFDANGLEYRQLISKMAMGATFYYTIKYTYLAQSAIGSGVSDINVRKTNWDQAFGLYGVPKDFPGNKTGLKYLGNYSNQVDPAIGTNSKVMTAYITGRKALDEGNNSVSDAQAIMVIDELERLLAGASIHELRSAKTNLTDVPRRNHLVTEAIGFLLALKHITNANISSTEVDAVLATLNYPAGAENLYDVTESDINSAIDAISSQYDFDAYKNVLRVASK